MISGCEVQSADPVISCVAPLTITSASLKFGRYDDSTCPDATVSSLTPYSSITVSLTPAIEQSSYTLDTTSGGLNALVTSLGSSDPDTGVYKQYQLTYTCGTAGGYACIHSRVSNVLSIPWQTAVVSGGNCKPVLA